MGRREGERKGGRKGQTKGGREGGKILKKIYAFDFKPFRKINF